LNVRDGPDKGGTLVDGPGVTDGEGEVMAVGEVGRESPHDVQQARIMKKALFRMAAFMRASNRMILNRRGDNMPRAS
jgi:hypothetical protein